MKLSMCNIYKVRNYQKNFISLAIQRKALVFGKFELKSRRKSPYFFNIGVFNTGDDLAKLGYFYAQAIQEQRINFDILFGPAYKGIPLVAACATILSTKFSISKSYVFNRKEKKDHGEGGDLVGADIRGKKVLIVDDVITAGTAIIEAQKIIQNAGGNLIGVMTALDRQERGYGTSSAINDLEKKFDISINSIITVTNICECLQNIPNMESVLKDLHDYRESYGV